tara:strand:- start:348 stop:524 length:177 start_codon:yes stop_codon:yes gene_type:complete
MNKYNIIASQVEADTTASFPLLLEDETFKNLLNKEMKSKNSIFVSAKKLSKYANDNLI